MTDAILPESTNSPAASLTSEPEKLLPETQLGHVIGACSEDDGVPDIGVSIGLGEGSMLWLGELLKRDGGDIGFVFHGPNGQRHVAPIWPSCEWQDVADLLRHHVAPILARLSFPVSGTDMVMVPREPTGAMIAAGKAEVVIYADCGASERDADKAAKWVWRAMLNAAPASPSTPIPVIAEAGERKGQGTFACPICDEEKPHHHTAQVVDAYQTKGSRK
ncbi:hypothetical protein [uncultured Sphingomonas sp.]|uniref:hypothetical protein n=1 Tax=uncultured Sphingomonas sp. TaxID=158754 RepID=UPI0025DD910C|nr:hypothetical protein [uncultured Sphingomonas sp.]